MSQISSREKKLIGLILALLFAFGNVIAVKWWRQEMADLKNSQYELELSLIEDEALYEERTEWENRQAWLDSSLQDFPGREAADAQLLKLVASSAKGAGVIIDSSELLEPSEKEDAYFSRAGVSVRARGSLTQLAKWIHEFQEPNDFRALINFEFENDSKKPGLVHCRFECWEWRRKFSAKAVPGMAVNIEE